MPIANQSVQSSVSSCLPSLSLSLSPSPPSSLLSASPSQPLPISSAQQSHYQQSFTPPFSSLIHPTQAQCSAVAPTINFNFHIQVPMPSINLPQSPHQVQPQTSINNNLSPISLLSSFFMNHNQQTTAATNTSAVPSSGAGAYNSAFVSTASMHGISEMRSIRTGNASVNSGPVKSDRLSTSLPLTTSSGVLRDAPAPQSPKLRPRTSVNEPPHLTLPASPLLSRSRLRRHLFRKDEVDMDSDVGMVNPAPTSAAVPPLKTSSDVVLSSSAPHQSFMASQLSSKGTASSAIPTMPPAHPQFASPRGSASAGAIGATPSKLLSPLTVSTSLASPLQVSSQSPRLFSSLLLRQIPPPDLSASTAQTSAPGATSSSSSSSSASLHSSPLLVGARLMDGKGKNQALLDQVHRTLASLTIHATKAATSLPKSAATNSHSHKLAGSLLHSAHELERSATMDADSWSDSDDSEEEEHEPFCECCMGIENGGRNRNETESTSLPQSSPSESEQRSSSHVPSSFFLSTSPSSNEEFSQSKSQSSSVFVEDQHAFDSDDGTANPRKFQSGTKHHSPRAMAQRKAAATTDEQSFYNSTAFSSDDDNENDVDRPQEPPTPTANARPLNSANATKNRFQPSRHSHLCRSARRRRNRKLRLKALKALATQSINDNKSDDLERMEGNNDSADSDKQKSSHVESDALQFNLTLTEEEEDRMT